MLKVLQIISCDKTRVIKVKEGIDFILSHFKERQQLFPRNISTAFSRGKQFVVCNREQILKECIKSRFTDCRINAYPVFNELTMQPPNLIFIDLDLSKDLPYQDSLNQLENIRIRVLKTIKEKLNEYIPTVLFTGNGYHIYIVLETRPLELIKELKELSTNPSKEFLKYAEMTLSNNKKDSAHNPTFKSSLLRIPNTFNSKNQAEVKIIQEFDNNNVLPIDIELLRSFRLWLADNDIRDRQEKYQKNNESSFKENITTKFYFWIEKLLQTPIPRFRRYCLYKIIVPYLVNIKKLDSDKCIDILNNWLDKCNNLFKLHFDIKSEISIRLKTVKHYKPISKHKLRKENPELFSLIFLK